MPVRRNFCAVRASEAYDERRTFRIRVPGNSCEFATLYDWRPFQIAKVNNLMSIRAFFFLLTINSCCKYGRTDQRDTRASRSNLFHATLLRQKSLDPELAKRYSSHPPSATQVNLAVADRTLSSLGWLELLETRQESRCHYPEVQ